MKSILFSFFLLFSFTGFSQQLYSKVKVYANTDEMKLLSDYGVAVDRGNRKSGKFIITDLSQNDIQKIADLGLNFEILIENVQQFYVDQNRSVNIQKNTTCENSGTTNGIVDPTNFVVPSTYGGYLKYTEMLSELDKMATLYPNLISAKAPISTFLTWENRPIYQVKISNNPTTDDGDPMVLYSSLHHAREPMSMSQLIYYMWYLLENYETNAEVKFLVDNTQMIFVPCVNPDGYIHNQTTNPNGGGMHRKNRNPSVGTSNRGVDLNRNYGYQWGTTGVSSNVNDDTYPGSAAFSEPESKAMRWLVQNNPIRAALNAHTYGDMLLFPIGTTANEYADHHDYFVAISNHMVQYNGYEASKSSGLYPASGDSDDYMYIMDNDVLVKDTVFAMTPEIGGSFWPASSQILPTCQEMLFTNLSLAHMVHNYYVAKETDGQQISTMTGNFNHSIQRLGLQNGSATVSIEPLLNIASVGSPVTYTYSAAQTGTGAISFNLTPGIQDGAVVKYVLKTDNGLWIQRDTIVKMYGNSEGVIEVFSDNASNTTNWTGSWSTTSSTYYSASTSFTDSPSGNYQNSSSRSFTLNNAIDLTGLQAAKATFYAKWEIEAEYDMCQFQVSVDNGSTWIAQCGLYTTVATSDEGVQVIGEPKWDNVRPNWVREEINLSDYLGQTIKVRFILKSDGGVRRDGFYFDDFKIVVKEEEEISDVGINEVTSEVIELFPNPSTGMVQFKGIDEYQVIEVFDIRGVVVHRDFVDLNKSKMDLSALADGTYLIRIGNQEKKIRLILL